MQRGCRRITVDRGSSVREVIAKPFEERLFRQRLEALGLVSVTTGKVGNGY
jgi:hypothetical protein